MYIRTTMLWAAAAALLVPATAVAAPGGSAPEPVWLDLLAAIINFSLYIGLIVFFAGKPIAQFYENRRNTVTAEIDRSRELREAAEAKVAEYKAKLDGIDAERDAIIEEYREIGEREKAKIIAEAQAAADKIKRDAELLVHREQLAAKAELQERLVDRAVELARAEVERQMTAERKARMVDTYIEQLGALR